MNVTVGTAPVNWNNPDIPDYRPATSYEQMLDEMAEAGYAGTEVGAGFPPDPNRAAADLAHHGLLAASSFCSVNLRRPEEHAAAIARAESVARYLLALGQTTLIVADSGDQRRRAAAGHADQSIGMTDEQWQSVVQGLHDLAECCAKIGARVVVHNHVGTYIETELELARLLESTDPNLVALCFDIGHMAYAGGDVMRVVDRFGSRLHYVHLKDVDPNVLAHCRQDRVGFHDALRLGIFPELGTGSVDFHAFFNALERLNYGGWIIVEQDTTTRTPFESARANREFLRREFNL